MYKIEVTELILYLNTSTLFFYFLLLSLLRNRSHSYATERKYYSGKLLNVQHGIFVDSFWIRQAKNASKCILEKRHNSKTKISLFHFHTLLNGPSVYQTEVGAGITWQCVKNAFLKKKKFQNRIFIVSFYNKFILVIFVIETLGDASKYIFERQKISKPNFHSFILSGDQ